MPGGFGRQKILTSEPGAHYPFLGDGLYTVSRSQVEGLFRSAVRREIIFPVLESRKIFTGVCFINFFS